MDYASFVRRLQARGKLSRDPHDLVERQWTDGKSFGQRWTLDEFEHERRDTRTLLETVNCSDVRMVQRGECTRLFLEPGEPVGILCEEIGQYLNRDGTMKLRVVRTIDLAHATGADQRLDPERAQLAAPLQTSCGTGECDNGRLAKRSGVVVCPKQRLDGSPQGGIVTAGVIEIRVPRWPIKGRGLREYAADVGPSIGMDLEPFVHCVTLPFQGQAREGTGGHRRTGPDGSPLHSGLPDQKH